MIELPRANRWVGALRGLRTSIGSDRRNLIRDSIRESRRSNLASRSCHSTILQSASPSYSVRKAPPDARIFRLHR